MMAPWTVESWNALFQYVGVFALVLTLGSAVGVILTDRILSRRQGRALIELQGQVAIQQERAAKAELELEQLKKARNPRRLDVLAFADALKDRPKLRAEVLFQPEDAEASLLAWEVFAGLVEAEWDVGALPPRAVAQNETPTAGKRELPPHVLQALPLLMRINAQPFGITILANTDTTGAAPQRAIQLALKAGGLGSVAAIDHDLANGLVRIVIGVKP